MEGERERGREGGMDGGMDGGREGEREAVNAAAVQETPAGLCKRADSLFEPDRYDSRLGPDGRTPSTRD